jgi:hypothetical protein
LKGGDPGAYKGLSTSQHFSYSPWHLRNVLEPLDNLAGREEMAVDIFGRQNVPLDQMVESPNQGDPSTFGLACRAGAVKVAKLMLSKCSSNQSEFHSLILSGIPQPLWLAANGGHAHIFDLVKKKNSTLWRVESGWAALMAVAPDGTKPLEVAVARDHVKAVLALADLYAELHRTKDFFLTILHLNALHLLKDPTIAGLDESSKNHQQQLLASLLMNCVDLSCDDLFKLERDKATDFLSNMSWSAEEMLCASNHQAWVDWERIKYFSPPTESNVCIRSLTEEFPKFNPEVESKFRMIRGRFLKQHKVSYEHILENAVRQCQAVAEAVEASTKDDVLNLHSVDLSKCNNVDCEILHPVLAFLQLLQKDLTQSGRALAPLKPNFLLIGSIAEGTRMGKADEVDISIRFQALRDHPLEVLKDNGVGADYNLTNLGFQQGCPSFMANFVDKHQRFDFPVFLRCFLKEIRTSVNNIKAAGKMPDPRLEVMPYWTPCKVCQSHHETTLKPWQPLTHCKSCAPTVTHNKIAACLILRWRAKKGQEATSVTVDVVPRFSVRHVEGHSSLCGRVTRFLLDTKPPGWRQQFYNIIDKDRILPENTTTTSFSFEGENSAFTSTIQLLNYFPPSSSWPCWLLRPGQVLSVNRDFSMDRRLRDVYITLKGVNSLLRVNVSSYVLKKVILQDHMRDFVKDPTNTINVSFLSQPNRRRL